MKTSPIFLIGFMGSGKTTLGLQLAQHFNLPFIDLDQQIQSTTGLSIPQIFDQFGEGYFRELETYLLRQLPTDTGIMIALGGGTPCHSGNMDWIREHGVTVYIKVDPGILHQRLAEEIGIRPLLHPIAKAELAAFISSHLLEREAWYLQADFVYYPENQSLSELINWLKPS